MAKTPKRPVKSARVRFGKWLPENWIKSILSLHCPNWEFRPTINWKPCQVIEKDNTAFGSMTNIGFALYGLNQALTKLRLLIIT